MFVENQRNANSEQARTHTYWKWTVNTEWTKFTSLPQVFVFRNKRLEIHKYLQCNPAKRKGEERNLNTHYKSL